MRIAWFGPAKDDGGVPGMGALLLEGILDQGVDVDLYTTDTMTDLARSVRDRPNLRLIRTDMNWQWGRWYSRKPYRAFVSGTIARTKAYGRLCDLLIEHNSRQRYDCIFQLSQTELFKLGRMSAQLPPIIVYPCVHSAGELRWHRRESAYALQSEGTALHYLTRMVLVYRSARQKREVQKPAMIIGMSRRFNELTAQDYDIDPAQQAVLYHPIRSASPDAPPLAGRPAGQPIRLLYVSRISVRKGLEQIVQLSHRLDDLAGKIQIDVIGDRTQWSDYRAHLKELNPRTSRNLGPMKHAAVMEEYERADGLLLPSMYEPGGLVVGEALSRGLPAVVSDEVGSGEPVDDQVCRKFTAGNLDEFEKQTRSLVADLQVRSGELRKMARQEAIEHFAPAKISRQLLGLFERAIARRSRVEPTADKLAAAGA